MPFQQIQGAQIYGRNEDEFATLTVDGSVTRLDVNVQDAASIGGKLVSAVYDYIGITGGSSPTSIVYKVGGASGTLVATLTLAYSSGELVSVTKT